MAMSKVNVIKLELKYCENCGGLWIRRKGDHLLYCNGCRQVCSNNAPSDQTRANHDRAAQTRWLES